MNFFGLNIKDNPNDIYFYQPSKTKEDTSQIFEVTTEDGRLRVKNENVNCLFNNLTAETFETIYNDFIQHLNLNFLPLTIDGDLYQLTTDEQIWLQQKIITGWIYYYTVNNSKVKVKRSDFTHPYTVDLILALLDKKIGEDTKVSLTMGAAILRQDLKKYSKTVKGQRWHYNK